MITETQKAEAQELYDKIGNIKKVAKITHMSYATLKTFIVFNNTKSHPIKKARNTADYRRNVKLKMIEYKGGKCQVCGYNKCFWALDFHHLSKAEKSFNISGGTKSFESMKSELDKCILVCANCHREIHAGIINAFDYT